MSADNGIFYREIDGKWWMMHGFVSDQYSNADYKKYGARYPNRGVCVNACRRIVSSFCVLEHGIIHDPSPEPPPDPLRELAQAILEDATNRTLAGALKADCLSPHRRDEIFQPSYPIRPEHFGRLKELLT